LALCTGTGPEKFQDEKEEFDIVVTCEARVFDQVNESKRWF